MRRHLAPAIRAGPLTVPVPAAQNARWAENLHTSTTSPLSGKHDYAMSRFKCDDKDRVFLT